MKKRRVIKSCVYCGKNFESYISEKRKCCSRNCFSKNRFKFNPIIKKKISNTLKGKMIGDKNPNYVPRVKSICIQCNKITIVPPSIAKNKKFCSVKCKAQWQHIHLKAEKNPNYKQLKKMNPGCRKEIRKKILKRDGYICRNCNKFDHLQIHHKDGNWKNNSENNLITLCIKCHAFAHELQNEIQISDLIKMHPINN